MPAYTLRPQHDQKASDRRRSHSKLYRSSIPPCVLSIRSTARKRTQGNDSYCSAAEVDIHREADTPPSLAVFAALGGPELLIWVVVGKLLLRRSLYIGDVIRVVGVTPTLVLPFPPIAAPETTYTA